MACARDESRSAALTPPPFGESGPIPWATAQLTATGVEQPRFEAQLLLALALGVSRTSIVAETYTAPDQAQWEAFVHLVAERARRVPLAYLRGSQEFYGLSFRVGPAVLIPRPETELLVDFALEKLRSSASVSVLADVGTGSGCIALATLAHHPQARALALDLSPEALALARNNAETLGVTNRIQFVRADLLTGAGRECFDLVLSNPPYIPTAELPTLQPEVRQYEPHLALDGGEDGLRPYRELAGAAERVLRSDGWLAVEVAMGQADTVAALFQARGLRNVAMRRDTAGIDRLVCGQKSLG